MPIELPPHYEAFKAQVISDQEAGDQGVCEVWWAANSRFRELPLSTRLAIAEAEVSDLLRERRVSLVRGEGSARGMNAKLWQMSRLRCWTRPGDMAAATGRANYLDD